MRKRLLTDEQVREIKRKIINGETKADLSRQYGVSPQLISVVCKYGYGERPKYGYKLLPKAPKDKDCWEEIARKYTEKNPDDPIKATTARKYHDRALEKLRDKLKMYANYPEQGE